MAKTKTNTTIPAHKKIKSFWPKYFDKFSAETLSKRAQLQAEMDAFTDDLKSPFLERVYKYHPELRGYEWDYDHTTGLITVGKKKNLM